MKKIQKLMSYADNIEQKFETFFIKHRWIFLALFTLIVVGYNWNLVFSFKQTTTGDFDYFAQVYEAIRKSILEYHQFPWWNPWVGGGVPLYANPQIGVFSLQTLLVLLFGTIAGLKISLIFYTLVGFWSFFVLAKFTLKSSALIAICTSTAWIANGFFISHYIGHYTFAFFQIFPLLCYLILNINKGRYWLYLSLCLSLMTLSALHYAVLQSILILAGIAIVDVIKDVANRKQKLILYAKAMGLFIIICSHRIIHTFVFVSDFPRLITEPSTKVFLIMKAFVLPTNQTKWFYDTLQNSVNPHEIIYGWGEYNAFVGYALVLAFILTVFSIVLVKVPATRKKLLLLSAPIVLLLIIAIGDFSAISPYAIIHRLPGFSGMRIASRWLIWVILFGLIYINYSIAYIRSKKLSTVVKILVVLGAIEVFAVTIPVVNQFQISINHIRPSSSAFEQFENYDHFNPPKNMNSFKKRKTLDRTVENYGFESTINNYGEVRGYEPLVDSRFVPTLRCGVIQGCDLIKSDNAELIFWSPNKIVLRRTAPGPIELNMNPSNYWTINGTRIFSKYKTVEINEKFIITDTSNTLTIAVAPKRALQTVGQRIKGSLLDIRNVIQVHLL